MFFKFTLAISLSFNLALGVMLFSAHRGEDISPEILETNRLALEKAKEIQSQFNLGEEEAAFVYELIRDPKPDLSVEVMSKIKEAGHEIRHDSQ